MPVIKGDPVLIFKNVTVTGFSDELLPMREFNALHLDVIVTSPTAAATRLLIYGIDTKGSGVSFRGTPGIRPSPAGQVNIGTTSRSVEFSFGALWARFQLVIDAGSGTYTVIATPYISDGPLVVSSASYETTRLPLETGLNTVTDPLILGGLHVLNNHATEVAFVQVFNAVNAAAVTLGTTLAALVYRIPAATSSQIAFPGGGVRFTRSLLLVATTTATGAVLSTGPVYGFPFYDNA